MSRFWMPLYVSDYLSDTRHLSTVEHGAYLLLIMQYWTAGGLPDDDVRLARVTCMSTAEWLTIKPAIQAFFTNGWRHDRIDQELAEVEKQAAAGRAAGLASAAKRKRTPRSERKPDGVSTISQRSANDPPTISQRSANDHGNDPPTISQPTTTTITVDRMGDARAREPVRFTASSKALADAFWKALGISDPLQIPAELAGVDYRAVEWDRAGWTCDLIGTEAARLARDRPLKPLNYFEKVFATAFAKRQAPLPVVALRQPEKPTVIHGKTQSRSGSLIDAIDRELADLESQEGSDSALPKGPVLRLSN